MLGGNRCKVHAKRVEHIGSQRSRLPPARVNSAFQARPGHGSHDGALHVAGADGLLTWEAEFFLSVGDAELTSRI